MIKELIIEADRMNLPQVQMFIDEQLEAVDCPMTTQIAIDVAVEELFVNISPAMLTNREKELPWCR